MATQTIQIQVKTGSGVPASALASGELAYDTTNKKLYAGNGSGANTLIGPATVVVPEYTTTLMLMGG